MLRSSRDLFERTAAERPPLPDNRRMMMKSHPLNTSESLFPAQGLVDSPNHEFHSIEDGERVLVEFRRFLADGHPCVGAHAAIRKDQVWLGLYNELGTRESAEALAGDLHAFLRAQRQTEMEFATFAAVFRAPIVMSEPRFETLLWRGLTLLDEWSSSLFPWDPCASDDPADPNFGFSFAGSAFYVVGLHPQSSRIARRFAWPALVFNQHSQFERLRQQGLYDRLRDTVRNRDAKLQGSVNPMLDDFGHSSEAKQYSGRAVEAGWTCPFRATMHAQKTFETRSQRNRSEN